jgi:CHAD domain-containing protein
MNQRERSGDRELQTTGDRLLDWRELVERCGRKPTKKRVHALRVATLRIQAEVEDELSEVPRASHEAQAMVRFGKLAEKLRDALGSVRELDVWIGKLEGLRETLSGSAQYVPRSSRETGRQLERLERRLTKKRERAGTKLVGAIEKRRDDLMAAAHHLEKAASDPVNEGDGEQQAPKLLKEFAGIVAEFPVFDEENLHEFRKRIKKIRYVAEIHSTDSVCGRIAEQMKTAQAAIGEWHDWQVLARIAADGKHAKDADALELLRSLAAEAFETAVATCHGVLQRMGDLGQQVEGDSGSMRKGPGRSESMMTVAARKLA